MPLVNRREPGGWVTAQKRDVMRGPLLPVFTMREDPTRAPVIAATGNPSMEYSRVALIGMS